LYVVLKTETLINDKAYASQEATRRGTYDLTWYDKLIRLNPETVSDNGLLLKPKVESLAPELACESGGDEALRLLSHGHPRTPVDLLKR